MSRFLRQMAYKVSYRNDGHISTPKQRMDAQECVVRLDDSRSDPRTGPHSELQFRVSVIRRKVLKHHAGQPWARSSTCRPIEAHPEVSSLRPRRTYRNEPVEQMSP